MAEVNHEQFGTYFSHFESSGRFQYQTRHPVFWGNKRTWLDVDGRASPKMGVAGKCELGIEQPVKVGWTSHKLPLLLGSGSWRVRPKAPV